MVFGRKKYFSAKPSECEANRTREVPRQNGLNSGGSDCADDPGKALTNFPIEGMKKKYMPLFAGAERIARKVTRHREGPRQSELNSGRGGRISLCDSSLREKDSLFLES